MRAFQVAFLSRKGQATLALLVPKGTDVTRYEGKRNGTLRSIRPATPHDVAYALQASEPNKHGVWHLWREVRL